MRKVIISLAAAAAALAATPALANEGRVEARGGIVFGSGDSEAVAGVAAGYDFDLGTGAFAGVEVSGDKILQDNSRIVFGATGRVGAKLSGGTKLYADAGYSSKPCRFCEDAIHAGAGVEVPFGTSLYGKLAYRHFFVGNGFSDYDSVVAGIGVRF